MKQAPIFPAFVHEGLHGESDKAHPDAQAAVKKEKGKLLMRKVWSEEVKYVPGWADVARQSRAKGKIAHMGRLRIIYAIKNAELPE